MFCFSKKNPLPHSTLKSIDRFVAYQFSKIAQRVLCSRFISLARSRPDERSAAPPLNSLGCAVGDCRSPPVSDHQHQHYHYRKLQTRGGRSIGRASERCHMPFSMRFLVCQSLLSVDNVNVSHLHISISFLSFSLCLCCVSFRCASEFGKTKKTEIRFQNFNKNCKSYETKCRCVIKKKLKKK